MSNPTFISAYLHVLTAAVATGATFLLGVAAWHLKKKHDVAAFTKAAAIGVVVLLVATLATMFMGDNQARLMTTQQPMKMAAAEALYNTEHGASFSLLTIGNLSGDPVFQIRVPHALSVLATGTWNGEVKGINQLQAADVAKYGPGNYKPILWVTYWSFRLMIGFGMLMLLLAVLGTWLLWRGKLASSRRFLTFATWMIGAPFLANSFGWIFTEMGRQPWIVYGLMITAKGVSSIGTGYVATSLIGFVLLYSILAIVEISLMFTIARRGTAGLEKGDDDTDADDTAERPFALVY
jgi:cytochrome d ubiquinol oxidase subunit I